MASLSAIPSVCPTNSSSAPSCSHFGNRTKQWPPEEPFCSLVHCTPVPLLHSSCPRHGFKIAFGTFFSAAHQINIVYPVWDLQEITAGATLAAVIFKVERWWIRQNRRRPALIKPLILQAINYSEEGLMTPYINGYYEAGYSFMWSIPAWRKTVEAMDDRSGIL